ncbi:hypothetical protein IC582_016314 [Cucumis melo]
MDHRLWSYCLYDRQSQIISTNLSSKSITNVTLADESKSSIIGSGIVTPSLSLSSVLHLPQVSFSLLSISQITTDLNCCVSFYPSYCLFQDLVTKKIIGKGHESRGLYTFDHPISTSTTVACSGFFSPFDAHCRLLGHPSLLLLRNLCHQSYNLSSLNCDSCQFAKFHLLSSSSRVDKRENSPFELVHSYIWGPCLIVSKAGLRYFVTFVHDHSRMTRLYFTKNHSELLSHFSNFHAEIRTQLGVWLRALRSDNVSE